MREAQHAAKEKELQAKQHHDDVLKRKFQTAATSLQIKQGRQEHALEQREQQRQV